MSQISSRHIVAFTITYRGAKETLQKIKVSSKKIATVTSRSRDSALITLTNTGLIEHIDILIALDDVTKPKPHPEGIYKALAHFGILPHEAVMVGDSDVDIMAGKSAGTGTIGVSYGFHGENIGIHNPDKVIKSLLEILTELNM